MATSDDMGPGSVTPVSLRTGTAGRPVTGGGVPVSLAITPDGRTLYATVPASLEAFPTSLTAAGPPAPPTDHRTPPGARNAPATEPDGPAFRCSQ